MSSWRFPQFLVCDQRKVDRKFRLKENIGWFIRVFSIDIRFLLWNEIWRSQLWRSIFSSRTITRRVLTTDRCSYSISRMQINYCHERNSSLTAEGIFSYLQETKQPVFRECVNKMRICLLLQNYCRYIWRPFDEFLWYVFKVATAFLIKKLSLSSLLNIGYLYAGTYCI